MAVNRNDAPELELRVTAPGAISTIATAPVELAARVVAFIELAAETVIPPVPADSVTLALFKAPAVVMLLPPALAMRLNVDPELALSETLAAVSVMATAPVEPAVTVVALTELMDAPPAPEDIDKVGVVKMPVEETPPELAVIENDVEAE